MTRSTTKEDSTGGLPVTGRRIYVKLALVTACLGAAVWAGFHFGHLLPELEGWISGHGALGYVVFIAAMVVCTSLFVPDTVFALLAGGLFGLGWVGLGSDGGHVRQPADGVRGLRNLPLFPRRARAALA